jgi:membrane protein
LVLLIGALLVCSVALTTALSAFGSVVTDNLPGMSVLISWAEFGLSFAIVTALFALVFRVLPDVTLPARAIWVGAATTSLLFSLGKIALSAYLAHGSVASPYGAAGALVVLLVWVYYSSQIFLLGAEFTRRYAFYSQNR